MDEYACNARPPARRARQCFTRRGAERVRGAHPKLDSRPSTKVARLSWCRLRSLDMWSMSSLCCAAASRVRSASSPRTCGGAEERVVSANGAWGSYKPPCDVSSRCDWAMPPGCGPLYSGDPQRSRAPVRAHEAARKARARTRRAGPALARPRRHPWARTQVRRACEFGRRRARARGPASRQARRPSQRHTGRARRALYRFRDGMRRGRGTAHPLVHAGASAP